MIELLRFREMEKVGLLQSILESKGIPTFVSNQDQLAYPIFSPALCIMNEADKDRAVAIIRDHLQSKPVEPGTELICPNCGERSPGNFAACWNCGASIDAPL
jgi:hypothetical protein